MHNEINVKLHKSIIQRNYSEFRQKNLTCVSSNLQVTASRLLNILQINIMYKNKHIIISKYNRQVIH